MLFGIISDLAFGFAGTPKGEHRFITARPTRSRLQEE
jgi:hypothetical protein